jgi:hypothetical protein
MSAGARLLTAERGAVDRWLMQSLMLLSSSEAARLAAAAWLAAFDAARAAGATELTAHARASEAWRLAARTEADGPAPELTLSASRGPPAWPTVSREWASAWLPGR